MMEPDLPETTSPETTTAAETLPMDYEELALTGPSIRADPLRRPVRGDLAHIRYAGKVFVPHYAVPMPRTVANGGTTLRKAMIAEGEALAELPAGETFQMLDMSGGWAWGQVGEDGFVGYVPLTDLEGVQ